jgi:hypothetical protein
MPASKCLIQTLLTRCCQEPFPTLQLSGMPIEGEAEPLRRAGCPTNRLTFLDFAKHRFDVDHWCAIDGFYWTDSQTLLAYFAYGDLMKTDRIGPIRRSGRKHSCEAPIRV